MMSSALWLWLWPRSPSEPGRGLPAPLLLLLHPSFAGWPSAPCSTASLLLRLAGSRPRLLPWAATTTGRRRAAGAAPTPRLKNEKRRRQPSAKATSAASRQPGTGRGSDQVTKSTTANDACGVGGLPGGGGVGGVVRALRPQTGVRPALPPVPVSSAWQRLSWHSGCRGMLVKRQDGQASEQRQQRVRVARARTARSAAAVAGRRSTYQARRVKAPPLHPRPPEGCGKGSARPTVPLLVCLCAAKSKKLQLRAPLRDDPVGRLPSTTGKRKGPGAADCVRLPAVAARARSGGGGLGAPVCQRSRGVLRHVHEEAGHS